MPWLSIVCNVRVCVPARCMVQLGNVEQTVGKRYHIYRFTHLRTIRLVEKYDAKISGGREIRR